MKPLRVRYKRIQQEVNQLLQTIETSQPPVPVEDIAKARGIQIMHTDFNQEISGLLIRRDEGSIIAVASEQAPARQRFTVAHELGHLMLHQGDELHVDKDFRVNLRSKKSSTAEDIEEIEANTFAAELLMPAIFLRRDLENMIFDIENAEQISELAKRYQVSTQAMTFRLLNLSKTMNNS